MSKHLHFLLLLTFICLEAIGLERREYNTSLSTESIKIDGILNENIWKTLPVMSNFIQVLPSPDKPSLYESEVWVTYTNSSIIIGANLHQTRNLLTKQLCARDLLDNVNADVFSVFFDTYDDHQNGFAFRVSSAGVQHDERLSQGNEQGDVSWDAVWHSHVAIHQDGWSLEMEIPFSALRFSNEQTFTWGINFARRIRKLNETSYWNRIDPQKLGFLAQTGILKGIEHISPPVRLFLFPYLSTGVLNQIESGIRTQRWLKSGGLDIKYGLNESFTLDVTLIPDFSQVISDNLVRNLSPFEQQLNENRPFFTEGTELFNKAGNFYSRRVGGRPGGFYAVRSLYGDTSLYEIKRNPNITTLYNAFKISGRTSKNLGIGIFNSVGAPMHAEIKDKHSGETFKHETEPLTNYNVLVFDKTLSGQSNLNFTNTNVIRKGDANDANVSSLLYTQFFKNESLRFTLNSNLSMLSEGERNIGTQFNSSFGKVSGRFTYEIGASMMSPKFEVSDMGIQFDYNRSFQYVSIDYNENKPISKHLQLYRLGLNHFLAYNTKPYTFRFYEISAYYFLLFKNFWDITFNLNSKPSVPIDYYQLGSFGKKLKTYPYLYLGFDGSSDSRKKLFWAYSAGYGSSNEPHTGYVTLFNLLRYRFNSKYEMSVSGQYKRDNNNIGYAYYHDVFEQPVVGLRDVKEYSGEITLKYNASPNVNFTARFRHYNSLVLYRAFHLSDNTGEWRNLPIDYTKAYDENFNLQNIDIFFNWIFKPGSRIVVSYKQWLNDAYILNESGDAPYFNNLRRVIKSPQAFELAFRIIYFLDYNSMKKKHALYKS